MSIELLAIIVGIVSALVGVVWWQLNSKIDRELELLWNQVGRDSNSGMRPAFHDMQNVKARTEGLGERVTRLEIWRNGKP